MRALLATNVVVVLAATGCISGSVTFPYSPVPVLLSRVQRVGETPGGYTDSTRLAETGQTARTATASDMSPMVDQAALGTREYAGQSRQVVSEYRARAGINAFTLVGLEQENDGYRTRQTMNEDTTTSIVDSGGLTAELLRSLPSGAQGDSPIDLQLDAVDVWSYSCFQFGVITRGFRGAPRGQVVSQ